MYMVLINAPNITTTEHYIFKHSHLEEKVRDTLIKTVPELLATKYNLLANICHDSPPGQGKEGQTDPLSAGCYRAHVQNKATEQW